MNNIIAKETIFFPRLRTNREIIDSITSLISVHFNVRSIYRNSISIEFVNRLPMVRLDLDFKIHTVEQTDGGYITEIQIHGSTRNSPFFWIFSGMCVLLLPMFYFLIKEHRWQKESLEESVNSIARVLKN